MTSWDLTPDENAEREARLADLSRPMDERYRREKLKGLADAVARESGINALEDHAERERLDGAWADQRREAMKARYAAEQDAREQGEELTLLDPPPVQRPDGWKPEGHQTEPATETYNLTGKDLQRLFGVAPPDDPETIPATADLGTILGVPRKAKPQPTPEQALRAQERSVEGVRAKLSALLKRKEREEAADHAR